MFCKCFCNFNQLLFTCTDIFDQCSGRFLQTYCSHIFLSFAVSIVPVDRKFLSSLVTEEHVLTDAHVRDQCQFLMDNDNSLFFTIFNFREFTNFSVIYNIAFIATVRVDTTQNIHKGRFTGAVFSNQSVDLAFFYLKIYIIKCLNTGECFGDIFHFQ